MLEAIIYNPYRTLGVVSNAALNEVATNRSKLLAYARVGRKLEFSLDLTELLGEPVRTEAAINEADGQLSVDEYRLRAGLMWWMRSDSPETTDGLARLAAGDLNGAIAAWEQGQDVASLQNLVIAELLRRNAKASQLYAQHLYANYAAEMARELGVLTATSTDMLDAYNKATGIDIKAPEPAPKKKKSRFFW